MTRITSSKTEIPRDSLFRQAATEGIAICRGSEILDVNDPFLSFFSVTRDDAIGSEISRFLDLSWQTGNQRSSFETTTTVAEDQYPVSGSGRRVDGTSFPIEVRRKSLGTPDHMLMAFAIQDVSSQKQTENELREREQSFRMLSEGVPIGIFQTDRSGNCLFANSCWMEITGLSLGESFTKSWYRLIHPRDRRDVRNRWQRCFEKGDTFAGSFRILRSSKSDVRWVHLIGRPVYSDTGGIFVGALEDITQRRKADEDLFQSTEELRFAKEVHERDARRLSQMVEELREARNLAEQATQAKSEFLANMSHEIRTPMTAVLGYADILIEECWGRQTALDALFIIKRNSNFLLEIINDILDLSKIEAGKLEIESVQVSLPQILTEIHSLMLVRAEEKGIGLNFQCDGDIPDLIESDPTRLRQILVNLIGNAVKFTNQGSVELMIRSLPAQGNEAAQLNFVVSDSGIGMTPDQVSRLFQPFTQADNSMTRKFGGTGLGLTITKRLVSMLGGEIHVHSELGVGSHFSVTISVTEVPGTAAMPFSGSRPQAFLTEPPSRSARKRPFRRVLLAEDGKDNQRLVTYLLKREGMDVTLAENGEAAVNLATAADETATPFDLILMDMQMPVKDGYTAARQLREQGYTGPIIALTAHAMSGDRSRCLASGCDDYATKPIDREQLFEMINRLCRPGANQRHPLPLVTPQVESVGN